MIQRKNGEVTTVLGDFNGKVGEERYEDVTDGNKLGERSERGEKLVEWTRAFGTANM